MTSWECRRRLSEVLGESLQHVNDFDRGSPELRRALLRLLQALDQVQSEVVNLLGELNADDHD